MCRKRYSPLSRLARCSECSSLYHQSCHSPALTKAILEEAGENWICKMCKQKKESEEKSVKPSLGVRQRSSGLIYTLKKVSYDEKDLEETVMTNKSSFSELVSRHAEWKSPTQKGKDGGNRVSLAADDELSKGTTTGQAHQFKESSVLDSRIATKVVESHETSKLETTSTAKSGSLKAVSKSSPPTSINADVSTEEMTFEAVFLAKAVPSIKPPTKAIPASQPSDSSQHSSNLQVFEPTSPPISRPRNRIHRKRDLVISDSEEEQASSKRSKLVISLRAAMKSASATQRPIQKPAPLKLPLMTGSSAHKGPELARKSAVVARKSGSKHHRESETPTSEQGGSIVVKGGKETDKAKDTGNLRSPISPIQSVRRLLRQPSPLPTTRPASPGASQRYSLQLILTKGASNNTGLLVEDNTFDPSGFDYSTPYPVSLSRVQRPTSLSSTSLPLRKRSREKNNFDILSLVPDAAVPVLEDGKLAFREGAVDGRTGQLKRGARKFKVGRIVQGEFL